MKKLSLKDLSFGVNDLLNRHELKAVVGGYGTCAWRSGNTGQVYTGYSSSQAQSGANQYNGNWCCSSCCSSSWAGGFGC